METPATNPNPNSELEQFVMSVPEVPPAPEVLAAHAKQFQELMTRYACAIREVRTKLEVLNDELSVRNERNPIEMIKSRVKRPESIVDKMKRRGYDMTVESMIANLDDIAGVRVICSFVDDIYQVADMLTRQDDIKVITVKDYIKNPKPNGYRSYHIIIEIPVFFSNETADMRVEVQIRTIAMDYWASLDHLMKYKKDFVMSDEITKELKSCADIISETDERMMALRQSIESHGIALK